MLNTKTACEMAINAGWIAGVISFLLTLTVSLPVNPFAIIDVILLGILTCYIYKKSKIASTTMVIYFLISKIHQLSVMEIGIGWIIVAMLFTLIYIQAMRATYVWNAKYRAEEQPEDNRSIREILYPKLDTKQSCERAIKAGCLAGAISCLLTFIIAEDPLMFIDVILIGVMAFYIYKKSKIASTAMVIYFLISKILQLSVIEIDTGWKFTSLLFALIYIQAMRATYIWHKKYKNEGQIHNQLTES